MCCVKKNETLSPNAVKYFFFFFFSFFYSPCMVANLWDVTDRDIDKYTTELLRTWLTAEDGSHLIPMVQRARKACKMKYLVGSSPVVYGLPVFLKQDK